MHDISAFYGAKLYECLTRAQTMSFQAWSELQGWRRQGEGKLFISRQEKQLVIKETGHWSDIHATNTHYHYKSYKFTNSYAYQFLDDGVMLSHLRLGQTHPVFLCHLHEQVNEQVQNPQREHRIAMWSSVAPHHCGEDIYTVAIDLHDPNKIVMHWSVSGKKSEQKQIIYQLCSPFKPY